MVVVENSGVQRGCFEKRRRLSAFRPRLRISHDVIFISLSLRSTNKREEVSICIKLRLSFAIEKTLKRAFFQREGSAHKSTGSRNIISLGLRFRSNAMLSSPSEERKELRKKDSSVLLFCSFAMLVDLFPLFLSRTGSLMLSSLPFLTYILTRIHTLRYCPKRRKKRLSIAFQGQQKKNAKQKKERPRAEHLIHLLTMAGPRLGGGLRPLKGQPFPRESWFPGSLDDAEPGALFLLRSGGGSSRSSLSIRIEIDRSRVGSAPELGSPSSKVTLHAKVQAGLTVKRSGC